MTMKKTIAASIFLALAYLLLWPVSVEPVSWVAPAAPAYEGRYAVNRELNQFDSMDMLDQTAPEGVVVDKAGWVYATTEQGWVMRWAPGDLQGEKWVKLDGRGLGICLGNDNDFWVADAYEGIYRISQDGELIKHLASVDGEPLTYANDIVMTDDGKIYFTESTRRFPAKKYASTYKASLLDILEHGRTGRMIEYNPETGETKVLMRGLSFANGITVDPDGRFLLVAETSEYRVWKYWLKGEKQGAKEIIIDNLPGFPDNILAGKDGRFWVGFTSPRLPIVDALADKPFLRKVVQRLPAFFRPAAARYGHILAISGEGKVLENLQDPAALYPLTTGASEAEGYLYISSLIAPSLARIEWIK